MKADDLEMRDDYHVSHGVKNSCAARLLGRSDVVLIEPALFSPFPSSEAVNGALRLLARAGAQNLQPADASKTS